MLRKNAEVAIVWSGGKLKDLALEKDLNHIIIPGGHPPRAMFGYGFTQLFFVLNNYGIINELKPIISTIPQKPGVYHFYDFDGEVIYVGKAKNLKRRVSSYFTKTHKSLKTKNLVSKITDISCIIVETEIDALLLENNLIKKHQPRYNILLKDDKSYPSTCQKSIYNNERN